MTISVYKKTATRAKNGTIYAFGRSSELDGKNPDLGGYAVWKLCENYDGKVRGGISKTWRYVAKSLSHAEAMDVMNKKCGYKAFGA